MAESDEQNNLRRVRVRVEGDCGLESTTGKTPFAPGGIAAPQPSDNPVSSHWMVASGREPSLPSKVVVRGWDPERKQSFEMEVPPGTLQDALNEAHQTGTPLDLSVTAQDGEKYLQWELKNVRVTSYSISAAGWLAQHRPRRD